MKYDYNAFLNECIKNREFLGYSYKDMSNCLIKVTTDQYSAFEKGEYKMTKDNLMRIIRVLCIEKNKPFDVNEYIDTKGLTKEEIDDLSQVIASIVGDDNAWYKYCGIQKD